MTVERGKEVAGGEGRWRGRGVGGHGQLKQQFRRGKAPAQRSIAAVVVLLFQGHDHAWVPVGMGGSGRAPGWKLLDGGALDRAGKIADDVQKRLRAQLLI